MADGKRLKVLVAAAPVSVVAITEALSGEFELDYVGTLAEATAYPFEQVDAIVCGLYFDESRMFDLLRYVQLQPKARSLPFICMGAAEHPFSAPLAQGVEIACRTLGAVGFIDLKLWYGEHGIDAARSLICQLVIRAARP